MIATTELEDSQLNLEIIKDCHEPENLLNDPNEQTDLLDYTNDPNEQTDLLDHTNDPNEQTDLLDHTHDPNEQTDILSDTNETRHHFEVDNLSEEVDDVANQESSNEKLLTVNSDILKQVETLTANQVYLQALLHQIIGNQERIIGKIALLDETKLMFTSPVKHFKKCTPSNLQPQKLKYSASSASKTIHTPAITIINETLPIAADIEETPTKESECIDISYAELQKLSFQSTSIPNMAKRLAEIMFSDEERVASNCAGTKGKKQLDINKINKIQEYVFTMYSMGITEQQAVWKKCKDAINEAGRRIK